MNFLHLLFLSFFALAVDSLATSGTRNCCFLSESCLQQYSVYTGDFSIEGTQRPSKVDFDACSQNGRGLHCVAKYSNGRWYCTAPGSFLRSREAYAVNCPGKVWPIKGKKEPCFRSEFCGASTSGASTASCQVTIKELRSLIGTLGRKTEGKCLLALKNLKKGK